MKNYLLQFLTYYYSKKNKFPHFNIAYEQAHSIGVLFIIEDILDCKAMEKLIQKLKQDGKSVISLALICNKENIPEFYLPFDFFTEKDITFWGSFTQPYISTFVCTPFDYLYCVCKDHNILIDYLLARSQARFRIGKYIVNDHFVDMAISSCSSSSDLVDVMHTYTRQLQ